MENLDQDLHGDAKRPTFLTVLCILTFIGSAWGIISTFASKDPGLSNYAGYYYWVVLLLNVGTLFGALQMWKLKKVGLFIWTACEVLAVVLMWIVIKGYVASIMNPAMDTALEGSGAQLSNAVTTAGSAMVEGIMNTVLITGSVFSAIFVVLYWINAKHLK
ncbi:MAG: hypothetical protein HYR91_12340 [Flavobacteriia bacterium]|nr:hypothetical protein [Flavobacteriia bacterium]